jgi:hypothetical protein
MFFKCYRTLHRSGRTGRSPFTEGHPAVRDDLSEEPQARLRLTALDHFLTRETSPTTYVRTVEGVVVTNRNRNTLPIGTTVADRKRYPTVRVGPDVDLPARPSTESPRGRRP